MSQEIIEEPVKYSIFLLFSTEKRWLSSEIWKPIRSSTNWLASVIGPRLSHHKTPSETWRSLGASDFSRQSRREATGNRHFCRRSANSFNGRFRAYLHASRFDFAFIFVTHFSMGRSFPPNTRKSGRLIARLAVLAGRSLDLFNAPKRRPFTNQWSLAPILLENFFCSFATSLLNRFGKKGIT